MNAGIIAFTSSGFAVGQGLEQFLKNTGVSTDLRLKSRYTPEAVTGQNICHDTGRWIGEMWQTASLLIFIGAAGIAVRLIAPFVNDKRTDPAVLVIDEQGKYCISLLSGHLGRANEWTLKIAAALDAEPVITTATDREKCFAVDLYGQDNGLQLENKALAKQISAALLYGISCVAVGIGCRKGAAQSQIANAVGTLCETTGIQPHCIRLIASIDLKKDEPGILGFCKERKLPFVTFSESELNSVRGDFSESLFVQKQTGVSNVCERSAVLACESGILICRKTIADHVTAAAAIDTSLL